MLTYGQIVFLQGDEATEALEILQTKGKVACIEYLAQWDNGDQGLEFRDTPSAGSTDSVFQHGEYILTYQGRYDYVGLERIVGSPENFSTNWKNVSFAANDQELIGGNSCLLAFHEDGKVYVGAIGGYVNGQWIEADNPTPLKPIWYSVLKDFC